MSGMEAVGVAGFACAGAKSLYKTIKNIKDAPTNAKRLASQLERLCRCLEQLQESPVFRDPDIDLRGLTSAIHDCNNDLQRYQEELGKILHTPGDTKKRNAWKRVKLFLSDDDVLKISQDVDSHYVRLTTQLGVVQSNATARLKDTAVCEMHRGFSDQTAAGLRREAVLMQQQADTSSIKDTLDDMKGPLNSINDIKQRFEDIPTMSAAQTESISRLVRPLQDQIAELNSHARSAAKVLGLRPSHCEVSRDASVVKASSRDEELASSLERLCALASRKVATIHNEEAEEVLEDLGALMNSMTASLAQIDPPTSTGHHENDTRKFMRRELKKIGGIATSSCSVALNSQSTISRTEAIEPDSKLAPHQLTRVAQEYRSLGISTDQYTADVSLVKKWYSTPTSTNEGTSSERIETIARIKALARHGNEEAVIYAHFSLLQSRFGNFSPVPSLCIGRIIPDDDPIFAVVQNDDLEAFQSMISQGQVTLRERSTRRAPLLHHARRSPRVFRFLVENGVDVDELSETYTTRGWIMMSLLSLTSVDLRMDECSRQLIDLGVDPLFADQKETYNAYWHAAIYGSLACHPDEKQMKAVTDFMQALLHSMLQLGPPFFDIKSRMYAMGDTIVTAMTNQFFVNGSHARPNSPVRNLEMIWKAGADIHAKNELGFNALHSAFCPFVASDVTIPVVQAWIDVLTFLISRGVDIDSKNKDGTTVSQEAYFAVTTTMLPQWAKDIGGLHGDLWDAALSRCGYDVYPKRANHPRIPQYTDVYHRAHFEEIWKGYEDKCPYYDDPPYWCHHMSGASERDSEHAYRPCLQVVNGIEWYECDLCNKEGAGCAGCHYRPFECPGCGHPESIRCNQCKVGPAVCKHCGFCAGDEEWTTDEETDTEDDGEYEEASETDDESEELQSQTEEDGSEGERLDDI